jgi:hypothetical protein
LLFLKTAPEGAVFFIQTYRVYRFMLEIVILDFNKLPDEKSLSAQKLF